MFWMTLLVVGLLLRTRLIEEDEKRKQKAKQDTVKNRGKAYSVE